MEWWSTLWCRYLCGVHILWQSPLTEPYTQYTQRSMNILPYLRTVQDYRSSNHISNLSKEENHHNTHPPSKHCVIVNCHCWEQQTATNNASAVVIAIKETVVPLPPIHLCLSKKIGQCNTDLNACNNSSKTSVFDNVITWSAEQDSNPIFLPTFAYLKYLQNYFKFVTKSGTISLNLILT